MKMGWFSDLLAKISKNNNAEIHRLFIEHVGKVCEGSLQMGGLCHGLCDGLPKESYVLIIDEKENDCDKIIKNIHDLIDSIFQTQIDKSDIVWLSECLDNIIDSMKAAAFLLKNYNITNYGEEEIKNNILKDVALIAQMTLILQGMVAGLRKTKLEDVKNQARAIKKLEAEADIVSSNFISFLHRPGQDFSDGNVAVNILRWSKIIEALEETSNSCDKAAKSIVSITRKGAC